MVNQARYSVLRIIGPNTRPKACAICCIDITSARCIASRMLPRFPKNCHTDTTWETHYSNDFKCIHVKNIELIINRTREPSFSPTPSGAKLRILYSRRSPERKLWLPLFKSMSGVAQILPQVYPRLRCGLQICPCVIRIISLGQAQHSNFDT